MAINSSLTDNYVYYNGEWVMSKKAKIVYKIAGDDREYSILLPMTRGSPSIKLLIDDIVVYDMAGLELDSLDLSFTAEPTDNRETQE